MSTIQKLLLAVGMLAVIGVVFVYYQLLSTSPAKLPMGQEKEMGNSILQKEIVLPAATGKVDDAVNAALGDTALDNTMFAEESADAQLLQSDSGAISDFGQSYNESEL